MADPPPPPADRLTQLYHAHNGLKNKIHNTKFILHGTQLKAVQVFYVFGTFFGQPAADNLLPYACRGIDLPAHRTACQSGRARGMSPYIAHDSIGNV